MTYELRILGRLEGLNQYISAMNRNRYIGAKMKADAMKLCEWQIRHQLRDVHITKPVRLHYTWIEPNTKRDLDNVAGFGHKVIQDALVACGVLDNDGWKNIRGFTDTFDVDKDHAQIVVLIEEVSDAEE